MVSFLLFRITLNFPIYKYVYPDFTFLVHHYDVKFAVIRLSLIVK